MCDDTGLFQHAVHSVPDRAHGYCVDDNARGLLLAMCAQDAGEEQLPEGMILRVRRLCAARLEPRHQAVPQLHELRSPLAGAARFRGQPWPDALGARRRARGDDTCAARRRWAAALFAEALPVVRRLRLAARLGLHLARSRRLLRGDAGRRFRRRYAHAPGRSADGSAAAVETQDWVWFEDGLAYDNARLSAGPDRRPAVATGTPCLYRGRPAQSLRGSWRRQTSPSGLFRPVGTDSFGDVAQPPQRFRPAAARGDRHDLCLPCRLARRQTIAAGRAEAQRAFAWFFGGNDLSEPLVDIETGSCRDGLHPDRRTRTAAASRSYPTCSALPTSAACRAERRRSTPPLGSPVLSA